MKLDLDDELVRKKLLNQISVLDEKTLKKVEIRSLNRAIRGARTEISRSIRKDFRLKSSTLKEFMTLRRASSGAKDAEATIKFRHEPLSAIRFGNPSQTRRGFSVTIFRGNRQTISGGFISDQLGGHGFVRRGPERLPIRKIFGPSVRQMAPKAIEKTKKAVNERMEKELTRNLARYLKRAFR